MSLDMFGDAQEPIADRVLGAYEHKEGWVNRLILGDSVQVMHSLIEYESLGGQVQMIYMDPPYGVKFGSNFQPFVRKRDVRNNDDVDMTREPETIKAYRDTWELDVHSYLTYMRDRLFLAKSLLNPSGSIFVQISDENAHIVRSAMDEVFGADNFVTTIVFQKTSAEDTDALANTADYLLWYAADKSRMKYRALYQPKTPGAQGAKQYVYARSADYKTVRKLTPQEMADPSTLPPGWKVCRRGFPLTSQHYSPTRTVPFLFEGRPYLPGGMRGNRQWSIDPTTSMPRLVERGMIYSTRDGISAIMDLDDIPGSELGNVWTDTGTGSFTDEQTYVVQTSEKVLDRCILMTTDPGDLVLDPTCGSGTTANRAEHWGRRWITIDLSRVPLALARQRLLTATYPYFRFRDHSSGLSGGFDYKDKDTTSNRRTDGVGLMLHHTLSSLAGEEAPKEICLYESPERDYATTRVSGPFAVEATIPTPLELDEDVALGDAASTGADYFDRMFATLRKAPRVALGGNTYADFSDVRLPARSLSLSAEAAVEGSPVAIVFGPEHGAVNERLVAEAAREAYQKSYGRLFVFGFAIEPSARLFVEKCEDISGIPATYVAVTPDVAMGDLLKNQRASQVFSVTGLPDVRLVCLKDTTDGQRYRVELLGLDTFDPVTMEARAVDGDDVPAWFLDTDFDERGTFHVSQAFFPRTSAWDNLRKELRGTFEDSVWAHLAGTVSEPFWIGDSGKVAVKVIDDRGNELIVVKALADAVPE